MLERFYDIVFVTQFDRIVEPKSNLNFELMKTNKNSKEKKMKMSKVLHLLFISEFESKRYDVQIFNQQTFEDTICSNVSSIGLKDPNLFNQQKRFVSAETSRSNQKFFSSFSEINEQITSTFKRLRFLSTLRASHNVSSKLDQSNILFQKMIKKTNFKKQAYAISLEEEKSDQFTAFHSAFSCFILSKNFYDQNQKRHHLRQLFDAFCIDRKTEFNKKFHRDVISSESINDKQMFKYQHFSKLIYTVKMKIDLLIFMKV